ncbi:MAG: lysophospholipid acyltransferase family protein [Bacilli bacterium]
MNDLFKDIRPVIEANINNAIKAGTFNVKVMPGDHIVTKEEREQVVFKYDLLKKKLSSKVKRIPAHAIVNKKTKEMGSDIKIIGYEHALKLKGKAFIITANHFSPFDSLIVRYLTNKLGYKNKLSVVVSETNLFMGGPLGKIVKGIDVLPYSNDLAYLGKVFNPALEVLAKKKKAILIYPEQEMWLDYPYPRPLMPGAYHYATKLNIPILPLFITWEIKDRVKYTVHVGAPIYPNKAKSLKDNKQEMIEKDTAFKRSVIR